MRSPVLATLVTVLFWTAASATGARGPARKKTAAGELEHFEAFECEFYAVPRDRTCTALCATIHLSHLTTMLSSIASRHVALLRFAFLPNRCHLLLLVVSTLPLIPMWRLRFSHPRLPHPLTRSARSVHCAVPEEAQDVHRRRGVALRGLVPGAVPLRGHAGVAVGVYDGALPDAAERRPGGGAAAERARDVPHARVVGRGEPGLHGRAPVSGRGVRWARKRYRGREREGEGERIS